MATKIVYTRPKEKKKSIAELSKHNVYVTLETKVYDTLTEASAVLAMKILIPSNVVQKIDSLASARENLRSMSADGVPIPPSTLTLMRSLRRCELAEERLPSGGLSKHAVQEERRKAWQSLLETLLAYVDQLESRATGAENDVDG